MPPLISVSNLSKSYGARPLFAGLSFGVEPGERVGLIGPNGAGKSTLLSILAGKMDPDNGELARKQGLRFGLLEQVPLFSSKATVFSTLLEGSPHPQDESTLMLAHELLSKLDLDESTESPVDKLSGGWKKRVALARELMREPDLLLLDEPTNHLDVESILWLETFLTRASFATITVTHDRYFLQRVSNRILELDKRNPGGILSVRGHYDDYLEAKQNLMAGQEKQESALKNTLRREQEWLRSGTKARTTKQQARIQRAGELKTQVSELEYRNTTRSAGIEFIAEGNNPKKLLDAQHLTKSIKGHPLFKDLKIRISPGSRIGILGPNGCGKSTLIRVLLGQEKEDKGTVFRADQLNAAYFEQNRESLDPNLSLAKSLSPHGDQVIYRGRPIHVRGYLDRFLFSQPQMNMPVGQLSGGEQSRLLIARLMLKEANLLVLDEPTNDLDLGILSLLEDCLTEFEGAVLLVTHDRFFLERVANQILAFHPAGDGRTEYFSSLSQWEEWHKNETKSLEKIKKVTAAAPSAPVKKQGLSFKEKKELDSMEKNLQKAESEMEKLSARIQSPDVVSKCDEVLEISTSMGKLQEQIDDLYSRWGELEKKK